MSPYIMGLSTQDSHSPKKHTEIYKILLFGSSWIIMNETQFFKTFKLSLDMCPVTHFLQVLNGFIVFNIGPINSTL